MAIEITMPALSPTMTEGKLAQWLVKEGDEIAAGDILAEIETDKATMEIEAVDDGILGKILVPADSDNVAVGTVIALIAEDGEDVGDLTPQKPPAAKAAPAPEPEPEPEPTPAPVPEPRGDRIAASPLARRLAAARGIDIATVKGSGPRSRVVKSDIEGFAEAVPSTAEYQEVKLSLMRKTIARRLSESKREVPHFYLTVEIEIDELLDLRRKLNERADDFKLSVNDFIIRAMALAARREPDGNVQFAGDTLLRFAHADISVAVAVPGGLVTPVIRAAETKSLRAISIEMKALAEKARAGRLQPADYEGGTISLSNLGMYGIKQFDAVINPPQAAILAVGTGASQAVVRDGVLAVATVMTATLSCDHRAIDGAAGAKYLGAVKHLIEDPLRLLI